MNDRPGRLHAVRPGGFARRDWPQLVHSETNRTAILRHAVAPARTVAVPPLPAPADWPATARCIPDDFGQGGAYLSAELCWYTVPRAILHGAQGLIMSTPFVASGSLNHTDGAQGRYEATPDGQIVPRTTHLQAQAGHAYTILAGGQQNYYHWMLDGIARLAALRAIMERRPGPLLVPAADGFYGQTLALIDWLGADRLQVMGADDTLVIERLIAPDSVSGVGWSVHPGVLDTLFRPMLARARTQVTDPAALPRRFYIDRTGSGNRRMRNEPALIAALGMLGVPTIRLEALSAAEQAVLFGQAELVIGAHGAGLTNLLYAPPTCRVIEIFMASYVNWCFRTIAAAAGVQYRAIVCGHDAADGSIHANMWDVDVPAVMRAAAASPPIAVSAAG